MAQLDSPSLVEKIGDETPLAAALRRETETCERLVELLRLQRAAVLGRIEDDIWAATCRLGEELQRLEDERALSPTEAPPPADHQPPVALVSLRRRLQMSQERLRLESQVSQEILADLLAYMDFCSHALGRDTAVGYGQAGTVPLVPTAGERCNQEA